MSRRPVWLRRLVKMLRPYTIRALDRAEETLRRCREEQKTLHDEVDRASQDYHEQAERTRRAVRSACPVDDATVRAGD